MRIKEESTNKTQQRVIEKQEQIKIQLAKENNIIEQILAENPTLEMEILERINIKDRTQYTKEDIQKFPFLPSKIATAIKQRFKERFTEG